MHGTTRNVGVDSTSAGVGGTFTRTAEQGRHTNRIRGAHPSACTNACDGDREGVACYGHTVIGRVWRVMGIRMVHGHTHGS